MKSLLKSESFLQRLKKDPFQSQGTRLAPRRTSWRRSVPPRSVVWGRWWRDRWRSNESTHHSSMYDSSMQPLILLFHAVIHPDDISFNHHLWWPNSLYCMGSCLRIFTASKSSIGHSGHSHSISSKFEHCAEPKWTVTALVSRFVFANLAGNETLQLERGWNWCTGSTHLMTSVLQQCNICSTQIKLNITSHQLSQVLPIQHPTSTLTTKFVAPLFPCHSYHLPAPKLCSVSLLKSSIPGSSQTPMSGQRCSRYMSLPPCPGSKVRSLVNCRVLVNLRREESDWDLLISDHPGRSLEVTFCRLIFRKV